MEQTLFDSNYKVAILRKQLTAVFGELTWEFFWTLAEIVKQNNIYNHLRRSDW